MTAVYSEGWDEPERSVLCPNDIELLRGLFSLRTGGGEPLVRGHLPWEAMTWEPGEPMEPSDLICVHNDTPEGKETRRAATKRYWDVRGRKRKPRIAGGSVGHKPSAESRRHFAGGSPQKEGVE